MSRSSGGRVHQGVVEDISTRRGWNAEVRFDGDMLVFRLTQRVHVAAHGGFATLTGAPVGVGDLPEPKEGDEIFFSVGKRGGKKANKDDIVLKSWASADQWKACANEAQAERDQASDAREVGRLRRLPVRVLAVVSVEGVSNPTVTVIWNGDSLAALEAAYPRNHSDGLQPHGDTEALIFTEYEFEREVFPGSWHKLHEDPRTRV